MTDLRGVAVAILIFLLCGVLLYVVAFTGLACARVHKRDILVRVFQETATTLNDNNIPYVIFWGTLLGAVRGGEIVPDDDDADFVVLGKDNHARALEALAAKYGRDRIKVDKFFAATKGAFKIIHVDVQFAERETNGTWVRRDITPHVGIMDADTDINREPVTMHGVTVYKPPSAGRLLKDLYGDDYMTPIAYKKTEGDPRHKVTELQIRRAFKNVGLYI
jgi:hypothetical protein